MLTAVSLQCPNLYTLYFIFVLVILKGYFDANAAILSFSQQHGLMSVSLLFREGLIMPPNTNSDGVWKGTSFSGLPELDSKLAEWLEWTPPESPDHRAIKDLIERGEFEQLEKVMMTRKTFGTAGIRAKMGPG